MYTFSYETGTLCEAIIIINRHVNNEQNHHHVLLFEHVPVFIEFFRVHITRSIQFSTQRASNQCDIFSFLSLEDREVKEQLNL